MTELALTRNRVTLVVLLLVFAGGIGSYQAMPKAEDPGFIIRAAQVVTQFPGASPERVEQLVTNTLEQAIQELPEVERITSTSRAGVSIIVVEVKMAYTVLQPIWDKLRRKVEQAAGDLPEGVIGPAVNDEFGDVFGIVFALTGDGFSYAEMKGAADDIRDEILKLPDAAKVEIYGAQDERIFIEYRNERLADLGLSPGQLRSMLETTNILVPGGAVDVGPERIILEPTGSFESVEDIRRAIVSVPGTGVTLFLEDIAEVSRGYIDPPRTMTRYNGDPCLILAVSMREGGNLIALGEDVRTLLHRLQGQYPIGLEFDLETNEIAFQPRQVSTKIAEFRVSIAQSVVIVGGVMLLFLGLRTGLVVVTLIPMAMLGSLLLMPYFGVGIDQMSLASLIIALGMLVDNAVVVSEDIVVRIAGGKKPFQAAVASGKELRGPLFIASLTTAAAFLPIYLAESNAGEYTSPIFVVVTLTLLVSWVLALTMIPLLCCKFLNVKKDAGGTYDTRFYRWFRKCLAILLHGRYVTVAVAVAALIGAFQLMAFVPNIFFPDSDRALFIIKLELPEGARIGATEEAVAELEAYLEDNLMEGPGSTGGGITHWATYIGSGGPRFVLTYTPESMRSEYAFLLCSVTDWRQIGAMASQIDRRLQETFPDVTVSVQKLSSGPAASKEIQVRISGEDAETLFKLADGVRGMLSDTPGPRNIGDDWGPKTKKFIVNIDGARARRAGVSNQDIALSLQTALSGFAVTELREGEDIIPVTMRSAESDSNDLAYLESVNVFAQATGTTVPLNQVATLELAWQYGKLLRRDLRKTVTVESDLAPGATAAEVNASLRPQLEAAAADWPRGYTWALGGTSEESAKAQQSIADKLPIAIFAILLLLVIQFNSFRKTAITIATIPLGLIGVILGLLVMQSYFGFMTLLGIVSLAGIVVNNAIVLIERIDLEINENGHPPARAIVEAAQRRLRPILLTTVTTIGGMIPLVIGSNPLWPPMAIAIMFGLGFSTLLTLGVVPALYAILFRVRFEKGFMTK